MNLDFSKWPGPDLGPNCLQMFNSRRHKFLYFIGDASFVYLQHIAFNGKYV